MKDEGQCRCVNKRRFDAETAACCAVEKHRRRYRDRGEKPTVAKNRKRRKVRDQRRRHVGIHGCVCSGARRVWIAHQIGMQAFGKRLKTRLGPEKYVNAWIGHPDRRQQLQRRGGNDHRGDGAAPGMRSSTKKDADTDRPEYKEQPAHHVVPGRAGNRRSQHPDDRHGEQEQARRRQPWHAPLVVDEPHRARCHGEPRQRGREPNQEPDFSSDTRTYGDQQRGQQRIDGACGNPFHR